jgi:dihydroorotate dehydrogenase
MVDLRGVDLGVKIGKLELPYPTFMGSGCYGSGEEFGSFVDLARIGAVVLKSVTRLPRLGNPTPRLVHTPAGMLNSIGASIGTSSRRSRNSPVVPVRSSVALRALALTTMPT